MASKRIRDKYNYDDGSETDSFNSAVCEMYNDVLSHTIIPEDEEVSFSQKARKERFIASRIDSFSSLKDFSLVSAKSAFPSCNSSYLLSVGESSITQMDDDLSFITEAEFEDEDHLTFLMMNGEAQNAKFRNQSSQSPGSESSKAVTPPRSLVQRKTLLREERDNDVFNLSELDAALSAPSAMTPTLECSDVSVQDISIVSSISSASF